MPRSEYKYTPGQKYFDPGEPVQYHREYKRQQIKKETNEIIVDETTGDNEDYNRYYYEMHTGNF